MGEIKAFSPLENYQDDNQDYYQEDNQDTQATLPIPKDSSESDSSSDNQFLETLNLTPIEHSIIEFHLEGFKGIDIAKALKLTPETVSRYLNRSHIKKYINILISAEQDRLRAMQGKFVDTIADGFNSDNMNTRLKTARLYKDSVVQEDQKKGIEEVFERILNMNINVQVNN